MGGSGWVAMAVQVSKILGSWFSPVAIEESQFDCPNRSHWKIHELFCEIRSHYVTCYV